MKSKFSFSGSLVLYHNHKKDVENVIKCFLDSKNRGKLFIIDNSKDDGFSYLSKKEGLSYIKTNKNLGFGAGHNIALKQLCQDTSSNYHIILNPDINFSSLTIANLIELMINDDNIGLISPKILNGNGQQEYLCKLIPTPIDLILRLTPNRWFSKRKQKFQLKSLDYKKPINSPYLSGCFMVFDFVKLQKIGFFDERYFMYPEDIDICRRMNEKYKTIYWPDEEIFHKHEKASFKSIKMFFIHGKNMIIYFNKWGWFLDKKRLNQNKLALNQNQKSY